MASIEAKRQRLRELLKEWGYDASEARRFLTPWQNVSSVPEDALDVIIQVHDPLWVPPPSNDTRTGLFARGRDARLWKPRRVVRNRKAA